MEKYLPQHMDKAKQHAKVFEDSMIMATLHGYKNNYGKVANYLETAARSLRELERMEKEKEQYDLAIQLLRRIKA